MAIWMALASTTGLAVGTGLFYRYRRKRTALYRELAQRRTGMIRGREIQIAAGDRFAELAEQFTADPIIRVPDFLTPESLTRIREEALGLRPEVERSYIPGHKQGGTVCYEKLHRLAPECMAVYHSQALADWIGRVVGLPVVPTCDHDQSSCSLLCYDRAGDHIGWHYDHNFYRGRHFTVLLSLVNRAGAATAVTAGIGSGSSIPGEPPCPAASLLQRRLGNQAVSLDTAENVLVLFEGARVRHRVTANDPDDLRVVLSMTYCTNPSIAWPKELARRVKEIGFYGLRALWD